MPVARFYVDEKLTEVTTTNSMLVQVEDIRAWADGLRQSLVDVCLPSEPTTFKIKAGTSAEDGGNMAVAERRIFVQASAHSKSLRQQRWALLQALEKIEAEAVSIENVKPGSDQILNLHGRLKDLTEEAAVIANADIDPQRVRPFELSPELIALRAKTIKTAWDSGLKNPAEAKAMVDQAVDKHRPEIFQQYLDKYYPPVEESDIRTTLTNTEARELGREYYKAFSAIHPDSTETQLAESVARAMSGGCSYGRWKLSSEEQKTPEFWQARINESFAEPREYRVLRRLQISDQTTPVDVMKAIRGNSSSERFPRQDFEIHYVQSMHDSASRLEKMGTTVEASTIFVMPNPEESGQHIIVRSVTPETPEMVQVTRPGHNSKHLILSEFEDTEDKLDAIHSAALNLDVLLTPAEAKAEIETLWEKWQGIEITTPEETEAQRRAVISQAREIAGKISPPGYGGEGNSEAITQLVSIIHLAGDRSDTVEPLRFRAPQGLNTMHLDAEPELVAHKTKGDKEGCTHVTLTPRNGKEVHYENIPDDKVSQLIIEQHRLHGGTVGVSTNIPGLACYYTGEASQPVFVGHWMSAEDKATLLEHSPVGLTRRGPEQSRAIFRDISDEDAARTDDWIASAITMLYSRDASDAEVEIAIENGILDADIILQVIDGDLMGSPKVSMGRFTIEEMIDQPEMLQTALAHKLGSVRTLEKDHRSKLIDAARNGNWEMALAWVANIYDREPEASPDPF